MPPAGGAKERAPKPLNPMDTYGARDKPGPHGRGEPPPRFIEAPPPRAIHDLLVMSHGPDTEPDHPANHACLNSLASRSCIIEEGGRPKTMAGRK